jgi:hypothetical protein
MNHCHRCNATSNIAGTVEAFTKVGHGIWQVCQDCLATFIKFMAKQENQMEHDQYCEFSVEALALGNDLDIAEHHALCECYECLVDPDQYRKFELENDINHITYQEKTA